MKESKKSISKIESTTKVKLNLDKFQVSKLNNLISIRGGDKAKTSDQNEEDH